MLQNIDQHLLNIIMNENDDVRQIITQLFENHHTIISTISHEIRNPLTLISSSLQIMEKSHPEVKDFSGWPQLMDDVSFLRLLLEELSSFNNGHTLNPSPFSIEKLLRNVSLSFAMALENQNSKIEFTSRIPENLGEFTGDKIKLEEVLLNLLRNAREAVSSDGIICLSAIRRNSSIIIHIQDNGCGIPQEHLKTIFNPFVTYKSDGTGLGLSISQQIIEAHGGVITVDSQPEMGSTFSICLPV